jgi:hemoglobin/transferrin/lactoferrin receptor protein
VVAGVAYDVPGSASGAELIATTVAAKSRIDDSPTMLVRTPGFVTLDLVAHWLPTERLTVEAGLFNLANRSYFEWVDVNNRAASDPTLGLYRRPGRNASASISYRW